MNKRKAAGTSRSKSNSTITNENYNNMKKDFKKKGGFPDNNKDGKITKADIFLQKKKTGTIAKKGGVKKKMMGGVNKKMYKSGGFLEPIIPNLDDL